MVNEAARQYYLERLGISSYYCRDVMPAAAPSPRFYWPEPEKPVAPAGQRQSRVAAQDATAALAQQWQRAASSETARQTVSPSEPTLRAHVAGQASAVIAAVENENGSTDGESVSAQPFSFVWFSPCPSLAILAEQPDGHRGRLPTELRALMLRILQALNPDFSRLTPSQVANFHWPFDRLSAAAGSEAARDAVSGFIAQRRRQSPAQWLLLLADALPYYLYSPSQRESLQHQQWHRHPVLDLQVLHVPSLQSLAQQPGLKRPAWAAMQKLMLSVEH